MMESWENTKTDQFKADIRAAMKGAPPMTLDAGPDINARNNTMNIENLFKAASDANLVHFPNAIVIRRSGGTWSVAIMKDAATDVAPHGQGPSPEAAMEAVRTKIAKALSDKIAGHVRESENLEGTLKLIT